MPLQQVRKLVLICCMAGLVAACGSSSEVSGTSDFNPDNPTPPVNGLPLGPVSCPVASSVTAAADIAPELLPSADTLWAWEQYMVDLGPRFTGSPSIKAWHNFLAEIGRASCRERVSSPV